MQMHKRLINLHQLSAVQKRFLSDMSSKKGMEFLTSIVDFVTKHGGYDTALRGIRIISGGNGRFIGEFTISKEHLNAYGGLHGGCSASIIDNATTYALMTTNSPPGVTIDLNAKYIKSPREGEEIIIDAHTVKVGKTLAVIDCVLKNKTDDSILVKGGQTKYLCSKFHKK